MWTTTVVVRACGNPDALLFLACRTPMTAEDYHCCAIVAAEDKGGRTVFLTSRPRHHHQHCSTAWKCGRSRQIAASDRSGLPVRLPCAKTERREADPCRCCPTWQSSVWRVSEDYTHFCERDFSCKTQPTSHDILAGRIEFLHLPLSGTHVGLGPKLTWRSVACKRVSSLVSGASKCPGRSSLHPRIPPRFC